jgi:hypothetical protein
VVVQARAYAAATVQKVPGGSSGARHATPLSSALRKFYLKVHPDLFTGHPKEQETNEASFKVLTEYLESYKQEGESATPYKVEFYVRVTGEGGSITLKHVQAALLLPSRHSSAEAREHILKNNISKLFRQCDYHEEIDVSGYGSSTKKLRSASSHETSFISVLMAASVRFKGNLTKKSAAQTDLDKLKEKLKDVNQKQQTKLASKFGIKFGIEVPAMMFTSPTERLKMIGSWLQNVESALEELKQTGHKMGAFEGKTIIFGHRKQGPIPSASNPNSIYLEFNENRDSWVETLRAIGPESDAQFQEKMAQKSQMETETAAAIGIKRIECSTPISLRNIDKYITLLQRIHMHAIAKPEEWNKLHVGRSRLTVRVVERVDGVFGSEMATGTMLFAIDRNVTDLLSTLQQYGPQLIIEHSEFEKAIIHLKERYSLGQLVISPNVSGENAVECLNRLIDGYHVLRQYLTGLNICISNDYAANEDAKILFVKYDFLF